MVDTLHTDFFKYFLIPNYILVPDSIEFPLIQVTRKKHLMIPQASEQLVGASDDFQDGGDDWDHVVLHVHELGIIFVNCFLLLGFCNAR